MLLPVKPLASVIMIFAQNKIQGKKCSLIKKGKLMSVNQYGLKGCYRIRYHLVRLERQDSQHSIQNPNRLR